MSNIIAARSIGDAVGGGGSAHETLVSTQTRQKMTQDFPRPLRGLSIGWFTMLLSLHSTLVRIRQAFTETWL
ncbi:MAG: hypothetical protein A4E19_09095 [Nitrospira sp. SG-bin1]|nr:MAG: hypothetical protein A4E19_09095 [Nitrospira sp. SG-bin1]